MYVCASIPVIYKFGRDMKPIAPNGNRQTAFQVHMKGMFLEKPGLLKEGLKREEEWSATVPGYNSAMSRNLRSMTALERSLTKLEAERALGDWAGQFVDTSSGLIEDDGGDGNMGKGIQLVNEDEVWANGMNDLEKGKAFDPDTTAFHQDKQKLLRYNDDEDVIVPTIITNNPCVKPLPPILGVDSSDTRTIGNVPIRKDAVIVIIRHGKVSFTIFTVFSL